LPEPATVEALVDAVARQLKAAGIDGARAEARLIVAHTTGLDRTRQLADPSQAVDPKPALALARRRAEREPMAYLIGRREFWGLDFVVGPGVLVPRPETETLIEAVLATLADRTAPRRVLDLGTGTGCLLLTLLSLYPNAIGIGVDRSAAALAYAARNRRLLGLEERALLVQGDWLDPIRGPFGLVVANPPYIAPGEPRDPETRHEPEVALIAGQDGLDAYRAIAGPAWLALAPGGLAVFEIGAGQGDAVRALLEQAGFREVAVIQDLAGRPRAVTGKKEVSSRASPGLGAGGHEQASFQRDDA
jgi:release factor glutamine methyltransferase